MKADRLALRGQLGGDLSEFAQKPSESCVLMSIKSDRPARDTPMSPDLLGRRIIVMDWSPPATLKLAISALKSARSGSARGEGVR
jgi:hypothetical protein